jgi:long-chain acyl-CoA synthetase
MLTTTHDTPLAATFAGKHLLLTGATGFFGKVWLSMMLDRFPDVGRITLLVRPRNGPARRRVDRLLSNSPAFRPLRERLGGEYAAFVAARVGVVQGHADRPGFGLTDASVLDDVDVVVHCAGLTDFEPDPLKALAANVYGAIHAADVAARTAGKRLVHISTCFVTGTRDGRVPEDLQLGVAPNGVPFDVQREIAALEAEAAQTHAKTGRVERIEIGLRRARALGWPNIYTYSKGLAEHCVGGRSDLTVTIARPAIVECALEYPFAGWNEGINTAGPLAWLLTTAFRSLPAAPEHLFDMVPVDLAAKGLTLIVAASLRDRAAPVWHLGTSDLNPVRMGRIIDLTGLAVRRYVTNAETATGWDLVRGNLDPIGVAWEAQGLFAPKRLRGAALWLRERLPERPELERVDKALSKAANDLARIEQMLALYKPFIHDHDWLFEAGNIAAESAALSVDDARHRYDVERIDWRHYWVDVEYPGLQKWSFPLLDGEQPPDDPACIPPVRLGSVRRMERSA